MIFLFMIWVLVFYSILFYRFQNLNQNGIKEGFAWQVIELERLVCQTQDLHTITITTNTCHTLFFLPLIHLTQASCTIFFMFFHNFVKKESNFFMFFSSFHNFVKRFNLFHNFVKNIQTFSNGVHKNCFFMV